MISLLDINVASVNFTRQRRQDCAAAGRRYCLFADGQLVTHEGPDGKLNVWLTEPELETNFASGNVLNIGKTDQYSLFAVRVVIGEEGLPQPYFKTPLLNFMVHEPEGSAQLVGRGAQLLNWQDTNRFCGKCGGGLTDTIKEYAMACDSCNTTIYPRIAPCIITLVTDQERLLLATNSQSSGKWYSTLAGFVEPGESLEQTLRREVYEEVGVAVKNITYFSSQPWPFPTQLMIGFFAEYAGGEITPDGIEIERADWFEPDNLPQIPGRFSIAGKLIHHFIDNHVK